MKNKSWAREEAVKIINRTLREKAYANIASKKGLGEGDLSRLDKALVTEIVNGTLRNLGRIDWIKSLFVKKTKIDPWIDDILRSGIYQIIFLDKIPDSAVCNESAELARKMGHEGTVKFVNGVLRNVSRNKDSITYPDRNSDVLKYLSTYYSHPKWMIRKWLEDFGESFTEDLLKANNGNPPFTIRCNQLKVSKADLEDTLRAENIELEEGLYNEEALYIRGTSLIEDKESFKKGYFQIQDESSMLVAHVLDPQSGEQILDVCSAPGGKTTHMAELMGNKGNIIARDIHANKLKLIKDSCDRLGITIVETQLFNAKELDNSAYEKFDRVLVDAPCSGLGVIRRKPDLRWKKSQDDFDTLSELQQQILNHAANYVKPQGVLVYSTCTINKTENQEVIECFLETHPAFYLESLNRFLPKVLWNEKTKVGYLELFPNVHKTDGFFIARLRKR